MRILQAHNRYQHGGGEDTVARDEAIMLRRYGHQVTLLEQNNDQIRGLYGKLNAAVFTFYSGDSRRRMADKIKDERPDIVHIHNWFPMLSPSIISQADALQVPVVQTLHNFRMICANGLLYRSGKVCTDCVGKSLPLDGILHGCYRQSRAGSAIVTAAYALHRRIGTWNKVDRFIAVSSYEREILIQGGMPADKVVVKPNYVGLFAPSAGGGARDYALYAGRLSEEKGIGTLLSAWNSKAIPLRLKIAGDGPMKNKVLACSADNSAIEYIGRLTSDAVYQEMSNARFLVFPSEWYETFGRTIVEAFAQGTPVLAADLGAARELVVDGVTGYLFSPGDAGALVNGALRFFQPNYEQLRENCRGSYLRNYTEESNYPLLMNIYAGAIDARKRRSTGRGGRL